MNTLDVIAKRKSTRNFGPQRVGEDVIAAVIKAACAAPIAMAGYESLHITVIEDEGVIARINQKTAEVFAQRPGARKNVDYGAKTLIFVSTAKTMLPPEMEFANAGIVVENMVLAATALGVDSVILGGAPAIVSGDAEMVKALGIPDGFKPVLGVALGYAAVDEPAKNHEIAVNRI